MNAPREAEWLDLNQQAVSAALERLRERLLRLARGDHTPGPPTLSAPTLDRLQT